jgi:hypothetical protein
VTPDPTARFLAGRQLARAPFDRAAVLLGDRWPQALASLRLAAAASDVVLVGPVAAALRGHPGLIETPRVGLIGRWRHQGLVLEQLMDAGAMQQGFDTAPEGFASRERWVGAEGAAVSVGWLLSDRDQQVDELLAVSEPLHVPGGGILQLPSTAALRARAARSPWPADRALVDGFDAVLAVEGEHAQPPVRPTEWIVLRPRDAVADRSVRAEQLSFTVPFDGALPSSVRRAIAAQFKPLVIRDGDPRTLRAVSFDATVEGSLAVTAAAPRAVLDDWLESGDLVAAVEQAVTDAYRLAARPDRAG